MDTTKQMDEMLELLCRQYKALLENFLTKDTDKTFRKKLQCAHHILTRKTKAPSMEFLERLGKTLKTWDTQIKQKEANPNSKNERRLKKFTSKALECGTSKTLEAKTRVIFPVISLDSSDDDDVEILSEESIPQRSHEIENEEVLECSDDSDSNSNSPGKIKAVTHVLEHSAIKSNSLNNTVGLCSSPVLVELTPSTVKELTTISTSSVVSTTSSKSTTIFATALKSVNISVDYEENNIEAGEDANRDNETPEENSVAKGSEKPSTTRNEFQFLSAEEELVSTNDIEHTLEASQPKDSEITEMTTSSEKVPNLENKSGLENEDDTLQTVYEIISVIEDTTSTDGKTNGANESGNKTETVNDHLSNIGSEEEKEAASDVYMELIHKIDILNVTNTANNEADEKNLYNKNISNNRNLEVQNGIILSNDENNKHSNSEFDEILDIDDKDTENFLKKLDAELDDPKKCTSKVEDGKKNKNKCKSGIKYQKSCDINERSIQSNQRNVTRFEVETGRTNYLGETKSGLQKTHLSPKTCLDDLKKFGIENPKSPDNSNKTKIIPNIIEVLSEPENFESPKKDENNSEIIVIEDDVDMPSGDIARKDPASLDTMNIQQDVINITDDELDFIGIYDGDLIAARTEKLKEPTRNDDESETVLEISSLVENNEPSCQSTEGSKEFVEKVGMATNERNRIRKENEADKENDIPNSENEEDSSKRTVETLSNTECGNISNLMDNWEDKSLDELQQIRMNLEKKFGFNLNDVFASVNSEELEDTSHFSDQSHSSESEPESFQMSVPYHHFGEISYPALIPQLVAPPDMCNWSQFQNIPYLSSNIQNSSQLYPYLGLPQSIQQNDPRLSNRLRLLYDKTTEPQRLQIPTSRIPQLPYPSDVLGAKAEAVQNEIRSNTPTLSQNNQVRTYAEYRKLKMEAAARKQAKIDAANRALRSQNFENSQVTEKRKSVELESINADESDGKENTANLSSSESGAEQIKHRNGKKRRIIRSSSDENQEHDGVRSVFSEIPKSSNSKPLRPLKIRKVSTENDANDRRGSNLLEEAEKKNSTSVTNIFPGTNHFELSTVTNRRKKFTKTRPKMIFPKKIRKEFLERKVQVRIKRIKDDLDSSLLEPIREIPFEKTVKKGRPPKSKSGKNVIIFNTNPEHHARSKYLTKCILCPNTSVNMVEHYRNSHHTEEVFISRLHSSDLEYVTKNLVIATPIPGQKKYSGFCLFCDKEIMDSFPNFNYHYSSHTGEFGYECRDCGVEKCCKTEIEDHCTKQCKIGAKWRKLFSYRKGISKINAFVCNKCNYVQLNRIHVVQHLTNQHNVTKPTDSDIEIITLIQRVDTDDRSSNISVVNEPVLCIKTEEIDLPYEPDGNISEDEISEEAISIKTENPLGRALESTSKQASSTKAVEELYNEDNTIMTVVHATDGKGSRENVGNSQNDNSGIIEINPSMECLEKSVQNIKKEEQTQDEEVQIAENAQHQEEILSVDNEHSQYDLDHVNYPKSELDCIEKLILSDESMNNNCSKQTFTNISKPKSVSSTADSSNTEGDSGTKNNGTAKEWPVNSNVGKIHAETEEAPQLMKIIQDDKRSNDLDDSAPKIVIDLCEETENQTPLRSHTRQYDVKKIYMIENFGFTFLGSTQIFFNKPQSKLSRLIDLREYVATTQKTWSGRCETCNSIILDHADELSLANELDHLINTHSRFNATVTTEQTINNPPIIIEYLNLVIKHLKPWLDTTISKKTKQLCANMSSQKSLFAFFKCMGDDCCFATINETAMLSHIYEHNNSARSEESAPKSWLECSYCDQICSTEANLLLHINDVHKTSTFQCSLCFYRSCHAYNVSTHIRLYHSTSNNAAILDCPGPAKVLQSELEIMKKIKINVKPILCEVCKVEFFVIDSLKNHMESVHSLELKLDSTKIGMFACIYCTFEVNNIFFMRKHMANKHPSDLLYTCARLNNPNIVSKGTENPSVVENCILVFVGETVDTNLFRKCLYDTDAELNAEHVIDLTVSSNDDFTKDALIRDNNVIIAEKLDISTYEQFETILNESENKQMESKKNNAHSELKCLVKQSKRMFVKSSPFVYKCITPNCQEALKDLRSWQIHVGCHMNESRDIKYKCPYCPSEYYIRDFSEHIYGHKFKHYFCYYCGEIFQTFAESENHLKTNHSSDKPNVMCLPKEFNTVLETTTSLIDTYQNYVVFSGSSEPQLAMENFTKVLKNRPKKDNKSLKNKPTGSKDNSQILEIFKKDTPKFVIPKIRFTCGVDSCNDILANDTSLGTHLEEKHKIKTNFQCAHCSYSIPYPSNSLVRAHLKCHGKTIYVCCFCDFIYISATNINRHLKKSHKNMSYYLVSDRMEQHSTRRIEMLHIRKHESLTKQCLFCAKVVKSDEMSVHVRTVHDLRLSYRCSYCPIEGRNYDEVAKHLETLREKSFRMKEIYLLPDANEEQECVENAVSKSCPEKIGTTVKNLITTAHNSLQRKRSAPANNEIDITAKEHTCPKLKKTSTCTIFHCPKCSHMLESEQLLAEHMSQLHGLSLTGSDTNNTAIASTSTTHDINSTGTDVIIKISNSVCQNKPMVNDTVTVIIKEKPDSTKADVSCIPSSSSALPAIKLVPFSKLLREDLKLKIPQAIATEDIMVIDSDEELSDIHQATTTELLHNSNENNANQSTQTTQSSQSQSACVSKSSSRSNSNEVGFHCFYCEVKHTEYQGIFQHWQNTHSPGVSFKYTIPSTDSSCLTQIFLNHLLKLGRQMTVFKCPTCTYKCYEEIFFRTHTISTHGSSNPPITVLQTEVSYGCSICNSALFENENVAVKHVYKFHTKPYLCIVCLASSSSYNYLKQHCIKMHGSFSETLMQQRSQENFLVYNNMYVTFPNGFTASRCTLKNTTFGDEEALKSLIEIVENEN